MTVIRQGTGKYSRRYHSKHSNRVSLKKQLLITLATAGLGLVCGSSSVAAEPKEHGAVTAIAAANSQLGAFVGYASGAVALCVPNHPCRVYAGTPDSAVTAIATNKQGTAITAWIGYDNGGVYFCAAYRCNRLE